MGEYQFSAYRIQDQANPSIPLVQVIPVMVYHGLEKWEIILPFSSYFGEIDDDFMRFLPSFDFIFTNVQSYPDEVIQTFRVRYVEKIFNAYKHFLDKTYIQQHFAEIWLSNYPDNNEEENAAFIEIFGVYLSSISGGVTDEEIRRQLREIENQSSNSENNMVATERFLAKLKKEGHQEGHQEGRQEGQEITILKMHHKTGWSAQQIAECTDYSVEYVQSVIDKHEKAIIDAYKVKF